MSFNALTPAQAERLALLAEECGEVVLAIGKILRHGYDSCNPHEKHGLDNREALECECGDVLAAIEILVAADDLDVINIEGQRKDKHEGVWQWMHHARKPKP